LPTTTYRKILRFSFPFEILNRDLKLIFASNFVGAFGDGLYSYLLPYYIKENLKANPVEVGLLYAVTGLVSAITLFFAGMVADRYDRKKIIIAGWIAWVPVPIIFSLAENWFHMFPGMLLWGFWLGGPTTTAYIVTSADKNKLTLTFTVISSSWSLGYIFSPALGGYLAATVGMRTVFYIAFIFYTLASLILFWISSQHVTVDKQQSAKDNFSFWNLVRTRKLAAISVFFAFTMFTLMMFRPFIPQFLADNYHYGDFEIGLLGSASFLGSAVLGIIVGRIGDRWKKVYALATSIVLCTLSLALLLASGNFYVLTITFFLIGASYITWSLMNAIIGPLAPEAIRARWVSIPQTVSMFSSFFAPYIGGIIYGISPYLLFTIATILLILIALMIFNKNFDA